MHAFIARLRLVVDMTRVTQSSLPREENRDRLDILIGISV